jgi:hypothetical protein
MSDDLDRAQQARQHARMRRLLAVHVRDGQSRDRLQRLADVSDWREMSDEDLGWLCRVVLQPGHLESIRRQVCELATFALTRHARFFADREAS